jgi:hypothetical protein
MLNRPDPSVSDTMRRGRDIGIIRLQSALEAYLNLEAIPTRRRVQATQERGIRWRE